MSVRIIHGECVAEMAKMPANSVDAIVTDPPYHLTTGKKRGTGVASDNPNSPAGRARIGTGFMGKAWDGGDVAHRIETWEAALRVLKPGGHLLAFSGTRTYHRMVCAIEDAGFEIRDQIGWLFGSGFPKSHNGEWGGTALKPAWEPIVLARKPLIGTVAANVRQHGTGALNIDGCRVPTDDRLNGGRISTTTEGWDRPWKHDAEAVAAAHARGATNVATAEALGRWPANLIHDGSEEVISAFPDAPGQLRGVGPANGPKDSVNVFGDYGAREQFNPRGDVGSAARFFYCAKADKADRNDGCDGLPEKVGGMVNNTSGQHMTRRDGGAPGPRANHHPTVKPTDLMRYLCRLVTPAGGLVPRSIHGQRIDAQSGRARRLQRHRDRTRGGICRDRARQNRRRRAALSRHRGLTV